MLKAFFKLLKILGFLLVFEMKLFKSRIEILGVCVCPFICRAILKIFKVSVYMDYYSVTCHTPPKGVLYSSTLLLKKKFLVYFVSGCVPVCFMYVCMYITSRKCLWRLEEDIGSLRLEL